MPLATFREHRVTTSCPSAKSRGVFLHRCLWEIFRYEWSCPHVSPEAYMSGKPIEATRCFNNMAKVRRAIKINDIISSSRAMDHLLHI